MPYQLNSSKRERRESVDPPSVGASPWTSLAERPPSAAWRCWGPTSWWRHGAAAPTSRGTPTEMENIILFIYLHFLYNSRDKLAKLSSNSLRTFTLKAKCFVVCVFFILALTCSFGRSSIISYIVRTPPQRPENVQKRFLFFWRQSGRLDWPHPAPTLRRMGQIRTLSTDKGAHQVQSSSDLRYMFLTFKLWCSAWWQTVEVK